MIKKILAAIAALLALAASAAAQSDTDWQKVIEAAKKEGKVVVYTATVGSPYHKAIFKAFEEKYGIHVELLEARSSEVRERVRAAGWDACFVIDERGVVLGRLGPAALAGSDDISAEDAMTLGPSTVRPALELDKAVERMRKQNLTSLPVTRSDGVLVGVLRRDYAEQALGRLS